jgi:heat shock protein HslJ
VTVAIPTLLAALIALSGCSDSDESSGMPPDDLANREFVSTAVTEDGEPRPLEPDTEISLSFEREEKRDTLTLIWEAGCNSAGAPVEISDDQLVIEGKRIMTTLTGCPKPLMAQDAWLWEFFDADPKWKLTDGELTLASGDTEIAFAPRA